MSKRRYWVLALGLLTVAVVVVMAIMFYLLVTLPTPANKPAPTPHRPVLNLPTAPRPTATSGPPLPIKILFVPKEPVKGYSNCEVYGFKGKILTGQDDSLDKLQVVVWDQEIGLAALETIDASGAYLIEIEAKPAERKLWVQVYQNDIPVSEPLFLKTQVDCLNGFQIYQVDWQALSMQQGE